MEHSAQTDNEELSLFEVVSILLKQKKWIIGIPLLAMVIATVVMFLLPNRYSAELKISSSANNILISGVAGTPPLIRQLDSHLQLLSYYNESNLDELTSLLKRNVMVLDNKEKILTVTATDTNPQMAANIANAYGEAIVNIANAQYLTPTGKILEQLEKKLTATRNLLTESNKQIEAKGVEKTLSQLTSVTRTVIDSLASIQADAAILSDTDNPSPTDALRLANVVPAVNNLIQSVINNNGVHDRALYEAVALQQRKAFLTELERRLIGKINEIKTQMAQDPKIVVRAEVPQIKSGPKRGLIIILAGVAALFLSILGVVAVYSAQRLYAQNLER